MDKESILKLTEMSEDEQIDWLEKHDILETRGFIELNETTEEWTDISESLADLAFRLRDEARKCSDNALCEAWYIVYHKSCLDQRKSSNDCYIWWIWNSKPIHKIQAALLAQAEEKK